MSLQGEGKKERESEKCQVHDIIQEHLVLPQESAYSVTPYIAVITSKATEVPPICNHGGNASPQSVVWPQPAHPPPVSLTSFNLQTFGLNPTDYPSPQSDFIPGLESISSLSEESILCAPPPSEDFSEFVGLSPVTPIQCYCSHAPYFRWSILPQRGSLYLLRRTRRTRSYILDSEQHVRIQLSIFGYR